jgi:hypothetical protein
MIKQFDIVKAEMILNIGIKVIIMKEMEVPLNGSCMKDSDSDLFDLYSMNSNKSHLL